VSLAARGTECGSDSTFTLRHLEGGNALRRLGLAKYNTSALARE
jgi:hypothetical protein